MEPGNILMEAAPPPPPPLPTCKPPPIAVVASNGSTAGPIVAVNGNNPSAKLSNGNGVEPRQELMADIRSGVKLKAKRDQVLLCSRTPNGGFAATTGGDSLATAEDGDNGASNGATHLKKSVHSELQTKLLDQVDQVDNASNGAPHCVLASQVNPDAPGAPPPLHIPMSTAIRVLQERERKEAELAALPPQAPRTGTLGRDGTVSGEKLMISHGKRNFTVSSTPKKVIKMKVGENYTPKPNLLGGEGKMSRDLKKLIEVDVRPAEEPLIRSPPPQIHSPGGFRETHLRSPEAIEISNTLKRLLSQEKVDAAAVPFKAQVALPEDHKISEQLKKLILEDMNSSQWANNNNNKSPASTVTTPSTMSQSSSVSSIPDVYKRTPSPAKPVMSKPFVRQSTSPTSPSSPKVKNGSLIDNSIRLPLPPRVPSPPPMDNPKVLSSQLSCDRLNKEFQEFNAYRAATLPSPKKITIPIDVNGSPNFEQKTIVSFAQDLAAVPNRYPDTVKVVKLVQNGETVEKLAMGNIKFVIDPETENVVQVTN